MRWVAFPGQTVQPEAGRVGSGRLRDAVSRGRHPCHTRLGLLFGLGMFLARAGARAEREGESLTLPFPALQSGCGTLQVPQGGSLLGGALSCSVHSWLVAVAGVLPALLLEGSWVAWCGGCGVVLTDALPLPPAGAYYPAQGVQQFPPGVPTAQVMMNQQPPIPPKRERKTVRAAARGAAGWSPGAFCPTLSPRGRQGRGRLGRVAGALAL